MSNKVLVATSAMVTLIALAALFKGDSNLAAMCAGGVIGAMTPKALK